MYSSLRAELSFEAVSGAASVVKPKYQAQAASLYGFVANKTYMPNLRFFGHYGLKNPDILMPEYKTIPEDDYPQDHVASLIQWLFPSFDRIIFVANQRAGDFVSQLTPTIIAQLLRAIIETQGTADAIVYAEIIDRGLHSKTYENIKDQFKKKTENQENQVNDIVSTRLESKKCKKIRLFSEVLVCALLEAPKNALYPEHVVEQALLAFFWKKAETRDDLQSFSRALGNEISTSKRREDAQIFNKDLYLDLQKRFLNAPEPSTSEVFLNPESIVFAGYGWSIYENPYPQLISYSNACFMGKSFPDCVETSLRNFFNVFFYDASNHCFDVQGGAKRVHENGGEISDELIAYYKKYRTLSSQMSQSARDDWAKLVSNVKHVHYLKTPTECKDPTCEIKTSVVNTMLIIMSLIKSPDFIEITREKNQKNYNRIAKNYTVLMQLFSDQESEWEWSCDEQQVIIDNNNCVLTFLCNDEDIFKDHYDGGHKFLTYVESGGENNWTMHLLERAQQAKMSYDPLLSHLYAGSFERLKLGGNLSGKQYAAGIFSAPLHDADKIPQVIEYVLKTSKSEFYPLLDRWLAKLPL